MLWSHVGCFAWCLVDSRDMLEIRWTTQASLAWGLSLGSSHANHFYMLLWWIVNYFQSLRGLSSRRPGKKLKSALVPALHRTALPPYTRLHLWFQIQVRIQSPKCACP